MRSLLVSAIPKPVRPVKRPLSSVRTAAPKKPKCICGHAKKLHTCAVGCTDDWCEKCGAECQTYIASAGPFVPSRSVRTSAPKRKARAKILPRCKHCAHPAGAHHCHYGPKCCYPGQEGATKGPECNRCDWCPGYAPAIGIRQKRRTPAAAVKLKADDLWTAIVHARPESCEVQRFYPHACAYGAQAMHGVPRTFAATRHMPINGFKGCAFIHKFFTDRPELWSAVLLDAWGPETFREVWAIARAMKPVDMGEVVASLRAECETRGIQA
jgi:hypothetical protein